MAEYIDPFIGVLDASSNCTIGFGQLHVSGTGWVKYDQIFFLPQKTEIKGYGVYSGGEEVYLKVAVSFKSIEQATA